MYKKSLKITKKKIYDLIFHSRILGIREYEIIGALKILRKKKYF